MYGIEVDLSSTGRPPDVTALLCPNSRPGIPVPWSPHVPPLQPKPIRADSRPGFTSLLSAGYGVGRKRPRPAGPAPTAELRRRRRPRMALGDMTGTETGLSGNERRNLLRPPVKCQHADSKRCKNCNYHSNEYYRETANMKPKTSPPETRAAERTPLLYKSRSVMALLEISHATVYRMAANGELELIRLSTRASRITSFIF